MDRDGRQQRGFDLRPRAGLNEKALNTDIGTTAAACPVLGQGGPFSTSMSPHDPDQTLNKNLSLGSSCQVQVQSKTYLQISPPMISIVLSRVGSFPRATIQVENVP